MIEGGGVGWWGDEPPAEKETKSRKNLDEASFLADKLLYGPLMDTAMDGENTFSGERRTV